ncbi:MAG: hypothetical protein BHV62_07005 [Eggerthella sp. 51_9]|nr:MAG: hypothetical protein BHV62_07005 [Eggerthella sp. 51_9]
MWGIGEETVIAPLVAPGPFCSLSFAEGAQGTCSVLSHSDVCKGVTEVGLEWELDGATCTNRALWGISNELIGRPVSISLEEGSLWVIFPLLEFPRAAYTYIRVQ